MNETITFGNMSHTRCLNDDEISSCIDIMFEQIDVFTITRIYV